jgi:hypothetical protein
MTMPVKMKRTLGLAMTTGSPFHRFYLALCKLCEVRRRGGYEPVDPSWNTSEEEAPLVKEAHECLKEMTSSERARAEEHWWRASPLEYDAVKAAEDREREEAWRPKGPCRNCGVREASTWWVGDSGTLGFVHGMGQPWCERCCVEKQIEHAEEVAKKLPKLRLDLERMMLLEALGRRKGSLG